MIGALISVIIALIVIGVIFWAIQQLLPMIPLPEPFRRVIFQKRSPSSRRTRPVTSAIGALPRGTRASNSSWTRGRPPVMSSPTPP